MLLRYGLENHLSICEYQELLCSAVTELKEEGVDLLEMHTPRGSIHHYVPVIALYGANAAGKSNMIDGLRFLFRSVVTSYDAWRTRKSLPHMFCKVDEAGKMSPSSYDCDILIDGTHYHYGFSITRDGVQKEWLYSYTAGPRRMLYERDFSKEGSDAVRFGSSIRKVDPSLRKLAMSSKFLFLSAAGEIGHESFSSVHNFFAEFAAFISANASRPDAVLADELADKVVKNVVEEFLRKADVGIVGLSIQTTKVDEKHLAFQNKLNSLFKEVTGSEFELPEEEVNISFVHQRANGTTYNVSKYQESTGTKHLLSLLVPILSALKNGKIVVLDEITTTLHTHLSRELINLFSSAETNPNNAQLFFSTHDTNLLSCGVLRRDQIWFSEKSPEGKTVVYPLTDFKVSVSEDIEKGYLQGRFGAIPFFGDISNVVMIREEE